MATGASPEAPPTRENLSHHDAVVRLVCIAMLVGVLQLPLLMFRKLVLNERRDLRDDAVAEIEKSWGRQQTLAGPILIIPLSEASAKRGPSDSARANQAYFLPAKLAVEGILVPERREKGIHRVTVYAAKLKLSGDFAVPDFNALGIAAEDVLWEKAHVAVMLSDLHGVRETAMFGVAGQKFPLQPGGKTMSVGGYLLAPLSQLQPTAAPFSFSLDISINGSTSFAVSPVGLNTRASISGAWPAPSFRGANLPVKWQIGPAGFASEWQVSSYGREFPQQWDNRLDRPTELNLAALQDAAFGVSLLTPVDAYRATERALKFSVLFLALVFIVFFLCDEAGRLRLHLLHYILVGAALCLFYIALLALAEFMLFGAAYLAAAGASTALISFYSIAILDSGRRALVATTALAVVYGSLYSILQMQDYAMLAGTAVLFAALAAVMWTTRKSASL